VKNNTLGGNWGTRFSLLLMGICGFGTFYFMVILAIQRTMEWPNFNHGILIASVPFGLFGLGMGAACLYGIVETFTSYRWDDTGIERSALFRPGRMRWDYVVDYKISGNNNTTIVLTDSLGQRMSIYLSLMSSQQRLAVANTVRERLAGLRDKQLKEMAWGVRTYRPARNVSWFLLIFAAVFLGFGLMPWFGGNVVQNTEEAKWPFLLIFGGVGIAVVLLFLGVYTWTLIISRDAITSSSLFRSRTIPFAQITSVMIRDTRTRNGTTNITTVEGAGRKISFTESMPDYTLVRDYIQGQAGQKAVEQGAVAAPGVEKKQLTQGLILMAVVSILGFGGIAGYAMYNDLQGLARQDQLDKQGVKTQGSLLRKYSTGNKSVSYLITYQYDVNGRAYEHDSPVTYQDYLTANADQPVTVTYLPQNPDTARAAQSIGRREAESKLHSTWAMFGMAFGIPILAFLATRKQYRQLEAQSLAASRPAS